MIFCLGNQVALQKTSCIIMITIEKINGTDPYKTRPILLKSNERGAEGDLKNRLGGRPPALDPPNVTELKPGVD